MSPDRHPLVSDWLGLGADRLTVRSGKVELGQRISTAIAEIAHEELTLPRDRIEIAPVRTGESPDEGVTSGSTSVEQSGRAVRLAAATLRRRALEVAAERVGGRPEDWTVKDGALRGPGTNRPLSLLELLQEADFDIPVDPEAEFLPPRAYPAEPPMHSLPEMVDGRYRFLHDMEWPDMLHARVVRPPSAGARLAKVPAEFGRDPAKDGIRVIRNASFLAVAGPREWPVVEAARRLAAGCSWSRGDGLPEGSIYASLTQDQAARFLLRNGLPGEEPIPPPPPRPDHAARYECPYTLHGALAPSAAMALWDGARLAVTTHSQGIYLLRETIAERLGLALGQVELTHAPGSGCYGHNGADDAAFEASLIAMALPDRPILLQWSRENEHCWEPFGPPQAVELAAWTKDAGRITRLCSEAISGTHSGRPRPGSSGRGYFLAERLCADPITPGPPAPNLNREGGMHRNLTPAYAIPDTRLVKNLVAALPHRTSALRCLGAAANIFALESLMDEIAHAEEQDSLAFRRAHLEDLRGLAVLDRLDEAVRAIPPPGRMGGRGMAYAQYKNEKARVATFVQLSVSNDARIRLDHAILVADAGRVIDLGGLEAQLEGGFLQGASRALCEEVSWDRAGILSRDWDSYPVLRFDNVPRMEVVVLDRPDSPALGVGEATPGPAIAAIANALFDAIGLRLRRLPFRPEAIRRAAFE